MVVLPVFGVTTVHVAESPVARSILYPVIGEPPSNAGALHESPSCAEPLITVTAAGASGVVFGITVSAELAWLSPKVFEAVTVTLYVRPFVNSLMVHESAPVLQVQLRVGSVGVPDATARAV